MVGCSSLKTLPTGINLVSLHSLDLNGCSYLTIFPEISNNISTLYLNQTAIKEIPTSIKNMLNLEYMEMRGCKNLETLPTGINLNSLYHLDLNGCSRLGSFPDFSTNISVLYLNQTGIREVPPWISNFSNLETLEMWECKELYNISPEIFKLPSLLEVSFSDCKKLTEVRWPENTDDNNSLYLVSFINCFSSNQEAFIQQSASEYMIFPGEVPPFFTHQSTGSSLNIPLHDLSLLNFKACVVVDSDLLVDPTVNDRLCFIDIEVECTFRDKHGNFYFGPTKPKCVSLHLKYNHQIIFDCHFPLGQECHQVMITFKLPGVLSSYGSGLKLKGCGVRLLECTPVLASQTEADESIADNDGGSENSLGELKCKDNSD